MSNNDSMRHRATTSFSSAVPSNSVTMSPNQQPPTIPRPPHFPQRHEEPPPLLTAVTSYLAQPHPTAHYNRSLVTPPDFWDLTESSSVLPGTQPSVPPSPRQPPLTPHSVTYNPVTRTLEIRRASDPVHDIATSWLTACFQHMERTRLLLLQAGENKRASRPQYCTTTRI